MADTDDWNPISQSYPSQPEWDSRSMNDSSPQIYTPGTPGQWSQENLTPSAEHSSARLVHDPKTPYTDEDYFSQQRGSVAPSIAESSAGYNHFLERANRTIAKDQKHVPDPFLDGGLQPSRPFGAHSRVSSVESISSIVEEKSNSPLNKAIASVRSSI